MQALRVCILFVLVSNIFFFDFCFVFFIFFTISIECQWIFELIVSPEIVAENFVCSEPRLHTQPAWCFNGEGCELRPRVALVLLRLCGRERLRRRVTRCRPGVLLRCLCPSLSFLAPPAFPPPGRLTVACVHEFIILTRMPDGCILKEFQQLN